MPGTAVLEIDDINRAHSDQGGPEKKLLSIPAVVAMSVRAAAEAAIQF